MRLLLGSDAYHTVTQAIAEQSAEIEAWKHVTLSTDEQKNEQSLVNVLETVNSTVIENKCGLEFPSVEI